jgi:hypothetical protein
MARVPCVELTVLVTQNCQVLFASGSERIFRDREVAVLQTDFGGCELSPDEKNFGFE